jgi:hypothetical protein
MSDEPASNYNVVTGPDFVDYQFTVENGCGNPGDNDSCDKACGYVVGVGVQSAPKCRRGCVSIPQGHEVKKITVWTHDFDQNYWTPCGPAGAPGVCGQPYIRFDGGEWYPGPRQYCVRMKNWSGDLNRGVRVRIEY